MPRILIGEGSVQAHLGGAGFAQAAALNTNNTVPIGDAVVIALLRRRGMGMEEWLKAEAESGNQGSTGRPPGQGDKKDDSLKTRLAAGQKVWQEVDE